MPERTRANRTELPPGTTTFRLESTGLTPVAVIPDTVPLAAKAQPVGGAVARNDPVIAPAKEVVLLNKLTVLLLLVVVVHWPTSVI